MIPTIRHIALDEYTSKSYLDTEVPIRQGAYLIQVLDFCEDFPPVDPIFAESVKFSFLDIEETGIIRHNNNIIDLRECAINDLQASAIVSLLKIAKENLTDVVVHCKLGASRSAAIAKVAVESLGFRYVKHKFSSTIYANKLVVAKLQRYC